MPSEKIIGAEFEPNLKAMLHEYPDPESQYAEANDSRKFRIRSADSFGQRSSASVLINRMYSKRGYRTTPLPDRQLPSRITLTASDHDEIVGTITIGFDSESGLHVDELFGEEIDKLRSSGRRVCEFTKLAMDSVVRSKRVLASLFHVAFIYAHQLMSYDDLLIEVNPRHVRYYHQMLGFTAISEPRLNTRVNAPAVLMRLKLSYAHDQIEKFGGKPHLATTQRSLYPFGYSIHEESGIIRRLRPTQPEADLGSEGDYMASPPGRPERPSRSVH